MTTSKNVCVCVDDYGYDEASNRAAIALADMCSISAISVLVQAPHASMGSQQLLALRQTCALGLHLNLTEVFTQNDFALPLKPLIVASHLHRLSTEKISQAIHSQLDIFERIYKIPPDFIDGHEHVHVLPMVRSLLLDILKLRYRCLPVLRVPLSSSLDFKSWVVSKVGAKTLGTLAASRGFGINRDFFGFYDFSTNSPYAQKMSSWLTLAQDDSLIMCHPGALGNRNYGAEARYQEFVFLSSPDWHQMLGQHQVILQPFNAHFFAPAPAKADAVRAN